jgi:hypothetical protein
MVIKKLELDPEENSNYVVMGIVSTLDDYLMAFHLNQELGLNFQRYDDFVFSLSPGKLHYSWFYYWFEDYKTKLYLISNSKAGKSLITKFRNMDFLLVFEAVSSPDLENLLFDNTRKINGVTGIFKLDTTKVKDIDLFFEELELHEVNTIQPKSTS